MQLHPFKGEYKPIKGSTNGEVDEYDIYGLAIRQNITDEAMKQMSFVSLMNILISSVSDEKKANEEDVRRFFG